MEAKSVAGQVGHVCLYEILQTGTWPFIVVKRIDISAATT
jgi:hypothetical protein